MCESTQAQWKVASHSRIAYLGCHELGRAAESPSPRTMRHSIFFGSDGQGRQESLKAPHLHSFQRRKGKASAKGSLSRDAWIKNEMLYCLGVVLLEIEFEDSLESLLVDSALDGVADLQHLMLLKKRAGRELSTLYGRIIRMCLDCDFGLGLDEYTLDDPRVQKIFYPQVVRQFQERMPEYNKIWSDE